MGKLWKIEMLGGLRIVGRNATIEQFRTRKTGALLAYLAHYKQLHPRDLLTEQIWPERSPQTGRNNLNLALSALRRQLEPAGTAPGSVLISNRSVVGLRPEAVSTDVAEFEAAFRQSSVAIDSRAALERVVQLYKGRFLAGFYEEWSWAEEQRLEDMFFRALEQWMAELEAAGERARALELAYRGLRFDAEREPLLEVIHRLGGQRSKSTPPPVEPAVVETRLPLALTSFVGREREMREISDWLSEGKSRVVTLTGPAGVGKTRLAQEALRVLAAQKTQSGFELMIFAGLAEVNDIAHLEQVLAAALQVQTRPEKTVREQIVEKLQERPILLWLDNFEQLLPHGAEYLQALLQEETRFQLLVTSRQRLHLEAEREYSVPALPLPASQHDELLETLAGCASVQLFIERAQSVRSDFGLTAQNAPLLADLVWRMEGMPLAIELVASRAGVLSLRHMLNHLQRRLDFPAGQHNQRPARQRSLRAAIGWSYQLLPQELKHFFNCLSVFRGGFTAEAAHAVCSAAHSCPEHDGVLDLIAQLQDASLVFRDEGLLPVTEEVRFVLLESLREYADEQLQPDERARLQRCHAEYFLRLVEEAEAHGPSPAVCLEQIGAEPDNIRAALNWSQEMGEIELGLRLASSLWWYWPYKGRVNEGRRYFADLLKTDGEVSLPIRAKAQNCAALLELRQGDYPAAERLLQASLESSRAAHDEVQEASALNLLGSLAQRRGNMERAAELLRQSLALKRHRDNWHDLALALTVLAEVEYALQRFDEARKLCEEAQPIWRDHNDPGGISWLLLVQGNAAAAQGDMVIARVFLEESLAIQRTVDMPTSLAATLLALGCLDLQTAQLQVANSRLKESLELYRHIGFRPEIATALFHLGQVEAEAGDIESARAHWRQCLILRRELNDSPGTHECRELLVEPE